VRKKWMLLSALSLVLAMSAVLLAGCGDALTSSEPASVTDDDMLREFVDQDEIFDDLGPYEAGMASDGAGSREIIDPLNFWRTVDQREREVEVLFDSETGIANVTVYRDIWGDLHVLSEDMVEYVKPFHHEGVRYATFLKDEDWKPPQGQNDNGQNQGTIQGPKDRLRHGPWELVELSGFAAESDTLTVSIASMRIQGGGVDVTVDDPLELFAVPDELLAFSEGDEVTVTVSGAPPDGILFLHTRGGKTFLESQGGGTFVGTWTVERRGRHCVWVEVMAHDTIYDSEYPEDTLIWGMPYVVSSDETEDPE